MHQCVRDQLPDGCIRESRERHAQQADLDLLSRIASLDSVGDLDHRAKQWGRPALANPDLQSIEFLEAHLVGREVATYRVGRSEQKKCSDRQLVADSEKVYRLQEIGVGQTEKSLIAASSSQLTEAFEFGGSELIDCESWDHDTGIVLGSDAAGASDNLVGPHRQALWPPTNVDRPANISTIARSDDVFRCGHSDDENVSFVNLVECARGEYRRLRLVGDEGFDAAWIGLGAVTRHGSHDYPIVIDTDEESSAATVGQARHRLD